MIEPDPNSADRFAIRSPREETKPTVVDDNARRVSSGDSHAPAAIPDHTLIRRIGQGAYGEVWLAQNIMGTYRAIKIVYRDAFESDRPYEREFAGIQQFEPVSRTHESQVDILHIGRNDTAG